MKIRDVKTIVLECPLAHDQPGLGITLDADFLKEYQKKMS